MSKSSSGSVKAFNPDKGPLFSVRFLIAILLFVAGIAWIAYYYTQVRVDPSVIPAPEPGSPKFMADLGKWNYAIGFGLSLLGRWSAPTPSRRWAAAAASSSGCSAASSSVCSGSSRTTCSPRTIHEMPVMNDLGNYNLAVGVGLMAVGFYLRHALGVTARPVLVRGTPGTVTRAYDVP